MSIPRWAVTSTLAMFLMVAALALAVLLLNDEGNRFKRLTGAVSKAEVRAIVGPPDEIEVLPKAECWLYGPDDEITEAKLCFGERGKLAWFAYGSREGPSPRSLLLSP
jgi:hypothetical protein